MTSGDCVDNHGQRGVQAGTPAGGQRISLYEWTSTNTMSPSRAGMTCVSLDDGLSRTYSQPQHSLINSARVPSRYAIVFSHGLIFFAAAMSYGGVQASDCDSAHSVCAAACMAKCREDPGSCAIRCPEKCDDAAFTCLRQQGDKDALGSSAPNKQHIGSVSQLKTLYFFNEPLNAICVQKWRETFKLSLFKAQTGVSPFIEKAV